MKRIDYLLEVFKSLINFILLLLSGLGILTYRIFDGSNNIPFIILLGIGVFVFMMSVIALYKLNEKILNCTKDENE